MKLLLDTNALLFWQARHRKLSRRAATEIERADALLVSAVTCWEVATLLAQRRIELDRPIDRWLSDLEAEERIELVPLSPRAATLTFSLAVAGFHGDPADRLIYATAAERMAGLVTSDERIRDFAASSHPAVRVIW